MKKYSACALALLLLLSLCAPLAAAEEAVIDVPRCAAAPEIDGIIACARMPPAVSRFFPAADGSPTPRSTRDGTTNTFISPSA